MLAGLLFHIEGDRKCDTSAVTTHDHDRATCSDYRYDMSTLFQRPLLAHFAAVKCRKFQQRHSVSRVAKTKHIVAINWINADTIRSAAQLQATRSRSEMTNEESRHEIIS